MSDDGRSSDSQDDEATQATSSTKGADSGNEGPTAPAPSRGFFTGPTSVDDYDLSEGNRWARHENPPPFSYAFSKKERELMRIYRKGVPRGTDDDDSATPVVITNAEFSRMAEHRYRIWSYLIYMSIRVPALVGAAVLIGVYGKLWLGLLVIGISIPVPWLAVVWANSRTPKHTSLARDPLTPSPGARRELDADVQRTIIDS